MLATMYEVDGLAWNHNFHYNFKAKTRASMPWPKGLKRTDAQRSIMKKSLEQARIEKLEAEIARLTKLQGDSDRDLSDEEITIRFQTKSKWRTIDGRRVDNLWLYAHAHELSQEDAQLFMRCRQDNRHLQVVLAAMKRLFRKEYIRRRSIKTGKNISDWNKSERSEKHWRGCARVWLECLAEKGFTLSQIFDAIEDFAPKNIDYVSPVMIASSWGERIKSWIPKGEREADFATKQWMDNEGRIWVDDDSKDGMGIFEHHGCEPELVELLRKERDERRARGIVLPSELKKRGQ